MKPAKHVNIVGAGFSGLTLAYELRKRGVSVSIFEKSSRVGGLISTLRTPDGLVETAANGLLASAEIESLIADLGLTPLTTRADSKKRFIFRGSPRRWPLGTYESLCFAFKFLIFLLFKKKPAPRTTLADWWTKTFTPESHDYLISPALQGIYAGDTAKMSAQLLYQNLFEKNPKTTKGRLQGTISFKNGMQELMDALEAKLEQLEVPIHLNHEVDLKSLNYDEVYVFCGTAAQSGVPEKLSFLPLITVTVFYDLAPEMLPPEDVKGFGILFPEKECFQSLGVLMNSFIFEHRGPRYNETWILGGARHPGILAKTDDEILQCIREDRKRFEKAPLVVRSIFVTRWPQAIPHYDVGLEEFLKRFNQHAPVYFHGNYLGKLGLSKLYSESCTLAEKITQS